MLTVLQIEIEASQRVSLVDGEAYCIRESFPTIRIGVYSDHVLALGLSWWMVRWSTVVTDWLRHEVVVCVTVKSRKRVPMQGWVPLVTKTAMIGLAVL